MVTLMRIVVRVALAALLVGATGIAVMYRIEDPFLKRHIP